MCPDSSVERRDNHDYSMGMGISVSNARYHYAYLARHQSLIDVEHDHPISFDNQDRATRQCH